MPSNDVSWLFIECSANSAQTGAKLNHENYQITLNWLAKVIKRFEFKVAFSLFLFILLTYFVYSSVSRKNNNEFACFIVRISITSLSVGDQWNKWQNGILDSNFIMFWNGCIFFSWIVIMLEVLQKSRSRSQYCSRDNMWCKIIIVVGHTA